MKQFKVKLNHLIFEQQSILRFSITMHNYFHIFPFTVSHWVLQFVEMFFLVSATLWFIRKECVRLPSKVKIPAGLSLLPCLSTLPNIQIVYSIMSLTWNSICNVRFRLIFESIFIVYTSNVVLFWLTFSSSCRVGWLTLSWFTNSCTCKTSAIHITIQFINQSSNYWKHRKNHIFPFIARDPD